MARFKQRNAPGMLEPVQSNLTEIELGMEKEFNFRFAVLRQFSKVIEFGNVEYRGGFYMVVQNKQGEDKEVYVPDTREIFCNSVFQLSLIMQQRFLKATKELFKKTRAEVARMEKDFLDASTPDEQTILGEAFYTDRKDKILLDEYKNLKLKEYQKLFSQLCKEISIQNYFQDKSGSF